MAGSMTADAPHSGGITAVKQSHVTGLDTVRAFAALSVVLAHMLAPTLPDMLLGMGVSEELAQFSRYIFTGLPAVIVFFVVSGFCIHYPYTRRTLPVAAFTVARWTRIMIPALAALLFAKLLHVRGFNFTEGYILWSIVCELWYYSLYPLFLLLSRKVSFEVQFVVTFMISLVLAAWLGSDQYGNAHIYGPGLNWLIALPSWLLGCVLANRISSEAVAKSCSRRSIVLWRTSVAMVASVLCWLTLNTPVGYYLTMNTFAILVFFWIRAEISAKKDVNFLFERAGKWSYSIYLFHMIFFIFVGKLIRGAHLQPQWAVNLITIPVVLWLCFKAYTYVEKPSHEYAKRLFKKYQNQFQHVVVATR